VPRFAARQNQRSRVGSGSFSTDPTDFAYRFISRFASIRALVAKRRAWTNIPPRNNRNEPICFSRHLYGARNLI